jgi:hypothetical protein
MNDIPRLRDYRDALASVRIPRFESAKLKQYAEAARTAALATIDSALEMSAPAITDEIIDEDAARGKGMVPVTVLMDRNAEILRTVCNDMRRGGAIWALVREWQKLGGVTSLTEYVSVWRIPE